MKKMMVLGGRLFTLFTLLFLLFGCESTYCIEYVADVGGSISGMCIQEIKEGEKTSTVTAIPDKGYSFLKWSDGYLEQSRNDTASSDSTFTAYFEEIKDFIVNYVVNVGGYIDGEETQNVNEGERTSTVTAVASKGYAFVSWSDGLTEEVRYEESVTSDMTIEAIFERTEYFVTYEAVNGYIEGESYQEVSPGSVTTTVKAIGLEGYRFIGWSDGYLEQSRNDEINSDITLQAIYQKENVLNIEISDDSQNWGVLEGTLQQTLISSEPSLEVRAVANYGYKFVCWSNGYTSPILSGLNIEDDLTIYAIFDYDSELPIFWINTLNKAAITSKEEYVESTVGVIDGEDIYSDGETAGVRGRGNSSWYLALKKSYRVKFDKKIDLFNNGKAKSWTLIANYFDRTLLRNYLAYNLSSMLDGIEYTTSITYVDVYLNDVYQGVYTLCEQIEVAVDRVMNQKEDESGNLDVPYLLELDARATSEGTLDLDYFTLDNGAMFAIKSPETTDEIYNQEQTAYIKNYLQTFYDALKNDNFDTAIEMFDINSFVDVYIINELFKNKDVGNSSFYLYKKKGGKLYAGPIWDFDMSAGNCQDSSPALVTDDLYASEANILFVRLSHYSEFTTLVKERWNEVQGIIDDMYNLIDTTVDEKYQSFMRNFVVWDVFSKEVFDDSKIVSSYTNYEEQISYLKNWLSERRNWLDKYFNENY